jgi:hypothetical protein
MSKKQPSIYNLENVGPDKPIETLSDAIGYIKRLSNSMGGKLPVTSNRLKQCMMVMIKTRQRLQQHKINTKE